MKISEKRLRQIIEEELKESNGPYIDPRQRWGATPHHRRPDGPGEGLPAHGYTVAGYTFDGLEEAKEEAWSLKRPVLDHMNNIVGEWVSGRWVGSEEDFDPLSETVGGIAVEYDPYRNIKEDVFGEGTPPEGEMYKERVVSMEEGPFEVASQIKDKIMDLLNTLQSREAKELDDPEMRRLTDFIEKQEKKLGIEKGTVRTSASETPPAWPGADLDESLKMFVKKTLCEAFGASYPAPSFKQIGHKHLKAPRSIGPPVGQPKIVSLDPRSQPNIDDYQVTPVKMISGADTDQLYMIAHVSSPDIPIKFYRSEEEAEVDLANVAGR